MNCVLLVTFPLTLTTFHKRAVAPELPPDVRETDPTGAPLATSFVAEGMVPVIWLSKDTLRFFGRVSTPYTVKVILEPSVFPEMYTGFF